MAGEEPEPFCGQDVVVGKVGKTVQVSPSVFATVVSRGYHHTVWVEGLVKVDLRVVLEDIPTFALLEPGAIVDPENEIVSPSLLVAVFPVKEHRPFGIIMMADTHGLRGHERIVVAESLEDIERFPAPLVTGGHVPEDSGSGGVPGDADADRHDFAWLVSGGKTAVLSMLESELLGLGGGIGGGLDEHGAVGDEDVAVGMEAVDGAVGDLAITGAVFSVVDPKSDVEDGEEWE